MKKFLNLTKRPSLELNPVNRSGWPGTDRPNHGKSLRRVSTTSLTTKNIHVVRGAYNIDLNKVDSSFTKLHRACLLNDDIKGRKYIQKIDCNHQDNSKRAPIHLATVNGNLVLINLLIQHKANINIQDSDGKTPLIKSIECGHDDLIPHLLKHGADPYIADSDGNNAFHWALLTKSIAAISCLIELEGKTSQVTKPGNSENVVESYNHQTLLETQRMCDEFRRKFNQKNQDNLELEKKVIHLESQSNHLNLDINSMEEHNKILECELEKVRESQESDRKELKALKKEVALLINKNNALTHERQQLASDLMSLRVSVSSNEERDKDTDNPLNENKDSRTEKKLKSLSPSNQKQIYIKATIDNIENNVKEIDKSSSVIEPKSESRSARSHHLEKSIGMRKILANLSQNLSILDDRIELLTNDIDSRLFTDSAVNKDDQNSVRKHLTEIKEAVGCLTKQFHILSTYNIDASDDGLFSKRREKRSCLESDQTSTNETEVRAEDFHSVRSKLQDRIDNLKLDLQSGP